MKVMTHPTNNHIYLIIVKNSEVQMLVVHSGSLVSFLQLDVIKPDQSSAALILNLTGL